LSKPPWEMRTGFVDGKKKKESREKNREKKSEPYHRLTLERRGTRERKEHGEVNLNGGGRKSFCPRKGGRGRLSVRTGKGRRMSAFQEGISQRPCMKGSKKICDLERRRRKDFKKRVLRPRGGGELRKKPIFTLTIRRRRRTVSHGGGKTMEKGGGGLRVVPQGSEKVWERGDIILTERRESVPPNVWRFPLRQVVGAEGTG